ncbi:DNA-binding protein [Candidatus Fermentibacteria bacterium]|nr:DNA-binding protein [Candidatus Fermentibacteria bacterium]
MTTITLQLDDAKAEALRKRAQRVGLEPEQLLRASVDDLIAQPDADFDHAADRVLAKNRELYTRLA